MRLNDLGATVVFFAFLFGAHFYAKATVPEYAEAYAEGRGYIVDAVRPYYDKVQEYNEGIDDDPVWQPAN